MIPKTLIFAAVAMAPFAAAATPPLGAPMAVKLDWGCDAVRSADINGDGLTDLAVLNRETGRVEILLRRKPGEKAMPLSTLRPGRWEPELDDAPFRRLSLAGDPDMRSLALGDLTGSGRTDIAFTGGRDALTIVFRDKSGEYATRRTYRRHDALQDDRTLAVAQLGSDKRPSLVMLAKDALLVFPPLTGEGPLPEPAIYKCDTTNASALSVADLNGDNRRDIAYMIRGERPELRVRFALASGGFGAERALKAEYSDINLNRPVSAPNGKSGYAAVNRQARRMETVAITEDRSPWRDAEYSAPATHALNSIIKSPALVAISDFATPGRNDLIVGDARGAKVRIYASRTNSGEFGECVEYPALSQLSALACGKFDGKTHGLLQLSEKEGILGYSAFDAAGRPAFPDEVKLEAAPVALAAADFSGTGRTEAAVFTRAEKGRFQLLTLRLEADGKWKTAGTLLVDDFFKREIEGALAGDFTGDGKPDLILLVSREPARLFANKGDGSFTEIAKDSAQRKAMLSGATPADIAFGDMTGDGKSSLIVSAQGFVRALRADVSGELKVIGQANTRRPTDKLKTPLVVMLDGGKPGILGYNDTDRGLEWLTPDAAGVFRHKNTVETGPMEPLGAILLPGADTKQTAGIIHVGKDRLSVSDLTRAGTRLVTLDRYETDLPGTVHDRLEVGDFGDSRRAGIILFDSRTHRLELITRGDEAQAWRSLMHFELFDENPFYRGRRNAGPEPHDSLCTDISAPGASDLILLMHDRLLVYPEGKTVSGK